jgi:hypothetical protein
MKLLLRKAINTYTNDGGFVLGKKSLRYLRNKVDPCPVVTNPHTSWPVWYLKYIYSLYFSLRYGSGIDIIDEDWDTLILLDACRVDDFREAHQLSGRLETRISRGVDSNQFVQRNFLDRELHDTVYVTANPHVNRLNGDEFHKTITDPIERFDPDIGAVRSEIVTEAAIRAHREYPNKRIIVHFMQPHDPPLGNTAERLREEYQISGPISDDTPSDQDRIMDLVADGEITTDEARTAYRETLKIVLEEVESLLNMISGKVVISADHGEHFGEQPYPLLGELYEHYRNPRTIELCKVPWFITDGSTRRNITAGEAEADTSTVAEETITEQLEALGYQ